jgi:hypothetical protein
MTWQIVVAMFIVIPVILLPVALVWYLNSGRILTAFKEMRERQVTRQREGQEVTVPEGRK